MLTLIIIGLVCEIASFALGVKIGKTSAEKKKFVDSTVPIANLIEDFEDYVKLAEGGLSEEADAAIKALKEHAARKYLPPAQKVKKPNTFEGSDRKDEWCDLRCFEKEMKEAINDDERITVITRWMKKYYFTTARGWQTWCIQQMSNPDGRNKLRTLFDNQE